MAITVEIPELLMKVNSGLESDVRGLAAITSSSRSVETKTGVMSQSRVSGK